MQKEYLKLIKNALAKDLSISVWDGEAWQVKRSTKYQEIKEAIESVEVAEVRLRDQEGNIKGWAMLIPDLDPEETIADHSYTQYMYELLGMIWEEV
jgi:hypothetical protein